MAEFLIDGQKHIPSQQETQVHDVHLQNTKKNSFYPPRYLSLFPKLLCIYNIIMISHDTLITMK